MYHTKQNRTKFPTNRIELFATKESGYRTKSNTERLREFDARTKSNYRTDTI